MFKVLRIVAVILLMVSYFMPWVEGGGFLSSFVSVGPWDLLMNHGGDEDMRTVGKLYLAIPIAVLITLVLHKWRFAPMLSGIVGLGLAFLMYAQVKSHDVYGMVQSASGMYLAFAAAAGAIILCFFKDKPSHTAGMQVPANATYPAPTMASASGSTAAPVSTASVASSVPAASGFKAHAPAAEAVSRDQFSTHSAASVPQYCGSCGTAVQPGHKFCRNCGTKVE